MIYLKPFKKGDPEAKLAEEWLTQDTVHQDLGIKTDDFYEKGTELVMVCDEQGPIMAVRFHKALRVAMQFRPNSRIRVAKVGKEVVQWLKELAQRVNCNEVIIRPGGKAKKFSEKLGFREFFGKFIPLGE
jgi:hypothetical protein